MIAKGASLHIDFVNKEGKSGTTEKCSADLKNQFLNVEE
jgi:hypothetical protein